MALYILAISIGMFYKTTTQIVLETLGILISFYGSIIFFSSITNFISFFALNNLPISCLTMKRNLIDDEKKQQNRGYISVVILCSIAVILMLVIGLSNMGSTILTIVPATIIFLFILYKLFKKKYSYEKTVILDNEILLVFSGMLCLALLNLYLVFPGNSTSMIFNSNFYIIYYDCLFIFMSILLSFNNNVNSYNFYVKIYNLGYSNLHLLLSILFVIAVGTYAISDSLKYLNQIDLINYAVTLIVASFASLLTARFIGFVIVYYQQLSHK